MSGRIAFEIECPNNHDQTVKFSQEEFEAEVKSNLLVFHCDVCDVNWPPTTEEIAKFRRQFSKE
jgi:hypothetical protein